MNDSTYSPENSGYPPSPTADSGRVIDVTPGVHSHVDALGVVSFKLGCGCTIPPGTEPDEAYLFKKVGSEYPCRKHGDQVITRSTVYLRGWKEPSPAERLPRPRVSPNEQFGGAS